MKNKEIEELLKDLNYFDGAYVLEANEIKELLSYIEQLEKEAELGEHYKHLYSEVKKQKDDVVEYIKNNLIVGSILDGKKTYVLNDYTFDYKDLLRMLGEIE